MILEFDENKEYTIEELEKLMNEYWNINSAINKKITELRIKDFDFTRKYVYSEMYGYMFVTWQKYENTSIYGDERMFFQGLYFNACLGDYRDDAFYNFDALHEWNIPIETFLSDVKDNKFREITKEEFLKKITETTSKLMNEISEWIEYIEKE